MLGLMSAPLAKVRHRGSEERLEILGHGEVRLYDPGFIASREVIAAAGMVSLRDALLHVRHWLGGPAELLIVDVPPAEIDEDLLQEPIMLELDEEGDLLLEVSVAAAEGAQPDGILIRDVLTPTLERCGSELVGLSMEQYSWGWSVDLTLRVPMLRQSVAETLKRGAQVEARLLKVLAGGELDAGAAAGLIRDGHPELLIDTYEGSWLEAKSAPYRLEEERGRYELAKDIAAFANASGGLILIGAKTKSTSKGDRIRQINECRRADVSAAAYRALVKRQIYPQPSDIAFDWISLSSEESGVFLIEIPAQQDGERPFLVKSQHVGGRVSELGVTLPTRVGDGTTAPRIAQLHMQIRAGVAALRGEDALAELAATRAQIERLEVDVVEGSTQT